jgi:hypothetical protein
MNHPKFKSFNLIFSGCILLMLSACGGSGDPGVPVTNSLSELKHSHISLMHGRGEQVTEMFRLLQPSVIAWGSDPVRHLDDLEAFRNMLVQYEEKGVILNASNVWILTATNKVYHDDPRYQEAVCVDIEGLPIVPFWREDAFYNGVPDYWACTNHPLFRAQAKERVLAGMSSGATMQHIDDHLGTYAACFMEGMAGCFCDHCMEGFRKWLTMGNSESELKSKGMENPQVFDYAELLRSRGIVNRELFLEARAKEEIPLWEDFLDFQREEAAEFIKILGAVADSTAGKDIPIGVNAYNLAPKHLSTSHYADYFCNEVQHYEQEDSVPPVSFMLGTALGMPVFATGTGVCWVHAQLDESVTRVRRWIAGAYAFGHYFMYSNSQWGFTEETGTISYQVPLSIYEPLCSFITENRQLFDGFEAVAQVGLLYDNAACNDGDWWVREVNRDLHYAHIPTALVLKEDKRLRFSTPLEKLDEYDLLLVPEGSLTEEPLNELFESALEKGKLMEWTGMDALVTKMDPQVKLTGGEKVWTLPRQKDSEKGPELVIHLLNQDYDPKNDLMNGKSNLDLFVSQELSGGQPAGSAWIYSPGSRPVELEVEQAAGGARIKVPELNLWAIVKID